MIDMIEKSFDLTNHVNLKVDHSILIWRLWMPYGHYLDTKPLDKKKQCKFLIEKAITAFSAT